MRKRYIDRKNVAKSERKKKIIAVVVLCVVIFYALFVPPLAHNILSGNKSSNSYLDDLLRYWGIVSKQQCELNCDTNHDGICDLNCDTNGDGICDRNCDTNHDGICDLNCDDDHDGICDRNCDTDGDGICDRNCDDNGDGKCDRNCDDDGDGKCDRNCDTNHDGKCDLNCDDDHDGKCDRNCDTDGDGVCDRNCDDDGDGKCDRNCDKTDKPKEKVPSSNEPSVNNAWHVGFTAVKLDAIYGSAVEEEPVRFTNTTATFDVTLNNSNDAISYIFTVKNSGTINAKVESINIIPDNSINDIIHFKVEGIRVGDKLRAGQSTNLKVTTSYNKDIVVNQNTSYEKHVKIVINYVQD